MRALYISYYTVRNGYDLDAQKLIATLERFELPYCVEGLQSTDWTWERATQYKAEFIRDRLLEFPDRALVWVDADARVMASPILLESLRCDVAAHWFRGCELLSGTLYIGPGRASAALVRDWIAANRRNARGPCAEQRNLQQLVESSSRLAVYKLPPEYAWIDAGSGRDLSWRVYGGRSPVILHTQASRRRRLPAR